MSYLYGCHIQFLSCYLFMIIVFMVEKLFVQAHDFVGERVDTYVEKYSFSLNIPLPL